MKFLTSSDYKILINSEKPLVEQMINENEQVQPNGIELTLKEIYSFKSAGIISFDNKERKISETEKMGFIDDWAFLKKGAYKIIFNEVVNIPNNMFAFARPRSSLLRCGVTIGTALWDSGYSGRSEALLNVYNEHGVKLKRNTRMIQLVFVQLFSEVENPYKGIFKGENV
jgi:dUTP pyrophosphatase